MSNKKGDPEHDWEKQTSVNVAEELERMRAQTIGALPLLIDDETVEIEATELATVPQRRVASAMQLPIVESNVPLPSHAEGSLEVIGGPALGKFFRLVCIETSIGRAASAIRVDDPRLSRMHATFIYDDGDFRVRDAGSANGTFLNGAKVMEYLLRDGDKLLLGGTTLLFRCSSRRR
jgi:hypothetical protein